MFGPQNGKGVLLFPNSPLQWDFDANQDGNLLTYSTSKACTQFSGRNG